MDYIIRATAADSQVRAFAAVTKETVETARKDHNTSPVATAALGRLLTAGAMMGVMMKGEKDILTLQVKADGPLNGITVTADSQGRVKGYVGNPEVLLPANDKGKLGRIRRCRKWIFECDQGYGTERTLFRSGGSSDRGNCRGSDLLFCSQ